MIEESLAILRRRLEEFERERENLSVDQTTREQKHRDQLEELSTEKEYESISSANCRQRFFFSTYWQQRLNEESDRLREQLESLQHEYDQQSRSFTEQIETLTRQNREYLEVGNEEFHLKDLQMSNRDWMLCKMILRRLSKIYEDDYKIVNNNYSKR